MRKLISVLIIISVIFAFYLRASAYSTADTVDNVEWVQQQNGHYCGPATAKMIIENSYISQSFLAGYAYLATDYFEDPPPPEDEGTPWYAGGTWWPMKDTLNSCMWLGAADYYVKYRNNTDLPTVDTLKNNIMHTINITEQGLAACISLVTGDAANLGSFYYAWGSTLGGLPTPITHWVAISGYTGSGAYIKISDPYAGYIEVLSSTYFVSAANLFYALQNSGNYYGIISTYN